MQALREFQKEKNYLFLSLRALLPNLGTNAYISASVVHTDSVKESSKTP